MEVVTLYLRTRSLQSLLRCRSCGVRDLGDRGTVEVLVDVLSVTSVVRLSVQGPRRHRDEYGREVSG